MKVKGVFLLIALMCMGVCCEDAQLTKDVSVESVSLNKESITLQLYDTEQLYVTIEPSNAKNQNVKWSSSDESVANVNNGLIGAVGVGMASINVTTEDGGKTAICDVTVLPREIKASRVTLDKVSLALIAGDTYQLTASVFPNNATEELVWSSSNENVAIVSSEGTVFTLAEGTTRIVVKTKDGRLSAWCDVVVLTPIITLDVETLEIVEYESYSLIATVSPNSAADKKMIWSSSDESVATVSDDGVVTALKEGEAIIKVKLDNYDAMDECRVTVITPTISLNVEEIDIVECESHSLTATVTPRSAAGKKMIWSSSDESVAMVSDNGVVTAIREGEAIIRVRLDNYDAMDECGVAVIIPKVVLSASELKLEEKERYKLKVSISPESANNCKLVWASDNNAVAEVYSDGIITAVSSGTATISVSLENGRILATCVVMVKERTVSGGIEDTRDIWELS